MDRPPREKLRRLEVSDLFPRNLLFEEHLNADVIDERSIRDAAKSGKWWYRLLPVGLAQTAEAFARRRDYDAVITWSSRVAIPFAFLLKFTGVHCSHISLLSWLSKPKTAFAVRFVQKNIDRIILWSRSQYDFALHRLRLPESKVVLVGRRVDHLFWRPVDGPTDIICSAGQEMRDYPTLIEALRGLPIRCHIATGQLRDKMFDTVKAVYRYDKLPSNVTFGKMTFCELRNLYARSRFVVVPLHQTDTDNGVTVVEEAMA
ncbi:MAG TPA: hypothetical protein VI758_05205, partial [Bacteroidota bacterium]